MSPRGWNPTSIASARWRLRPSSPAPTSSSRQSETWITSSAPRAVERGATEVPEVLRVALTAWPEVCRAGISPNARPVAIERSREKPSARASSAGAKTPNEKSPGSGIRVIRPIDQLATTSPAAPPRTPSATLSVRSCRTSRPRLAPRAWRTAISLRRAAARASRRFARLAHAIASAMPAAPTSIARNPTGLPDCPNPAALRRVGSSVRFSVPAVAVGKRGGFALHREVEGGLRLRERDARLQTSEDRQPAPPPPLEVERAELAGRQMRPRADRDPEIGRHAETRSAESGRRHADHGERGAVQLDRLARDRRIGPEARLPESLAEHDEGFAGGFVGRREEASRGRTRAEHVEVVARDDDAADSGRRIAAREAHLALPPGGQTLEARRRRVADRAVPGVGGGLAAPRPRAPPAARRPAGDAARPHPSG